MLPGCTATIKKLDQETEYHLRSGVQIPNIEAIIEKLMVNAMEAKSSSIHIYIITKPNFSIEVRDDGVGIDYSGMKAIGDSRNVSSKIDSKGESLHSIITTCSIVRMTSKGIGYPLSFSSLFVDGQRKRMEQASSNSSSNRSGTSILVEGIFNNYPVRKRQLEENPDQSIRSIVDYLEVESFKMFYLDIQLELRCDGMTILNFSNSEKEQAIHQRIRKRYEELTRRRDLFPIENMKFGELIINGVVDRSDRNSKIKIALINNKVHPIESLVKKGEEDFGSFVLCASLLQAQSSRCASTINTEFRNALFYSKLCNSNDGSSSVASEVQQAHHHVYNEESNETKTEFAPMSSSLYEKMYSQNRSQLNKSGERLNIAQLIRKSKELNGFTSSPQPQRRKFVNRPEKKKQQILNISLEKNQMKKLKLINQWEKKFILTSLTTSENGLLLIAVDQHAADERIRLEKIQQQIFNYQSQTPGSWVKPISKISTTTIRVEGVKTVSLLKQKKEKLKNWYWDFDIIHEESFSALLKLKSIPCLHIEKESIELGFEAMMTFLNELEFDSTCWYPKRVLELIQSKACRGAIMFGDALTSEQCSQLLQQLSECQLPFQCAHGRPSK